MSGASLAHHSPHFPGQLGFWGEMACNVFLLQANLAIRMRSTIGGDQKERPYRRVYIYIYAYMYIIQGFQSRFTTPKRLLTWTPV